MTKESANSPGEASGPGSPSAGVEIVFPPDERTQVKDTLTFPARRIGQLIMTFPNGKTYSGTGTLLDEYHVLTAAHNLYGTNIGGWASSVSFSPGRNGQHNDPFGTHNAAKMNIPEEYQFASPPSPLSTPDGVVVDYTRYAYDFALITLDKPFMPENIGLFAFDDDFLKQAAIGIMGYPGDKPPGTMWQETGRLTSVTEEFLFYKIDTYKGQSGSSLLSIRNLQLYSAGVHVAGSKDLDTNFAVRLNQDNINQILRWM